MRRTMVVAMLALSVAARVHAQSWEMPTFFAPKAHDDIGLYLISPEHGDLGFVGIWRQSGRINLGVRAGMGGFSGNRTALVGAEFYGNVVTPRESSPLAVAWLVGFGASFDDVTWLRIPAGVSIGAELGSPSFRIMPYAHPRVSFDLFAVDVGGGNEETDSEVNLDVDVGAGLMLGTSWVARAGYTIGDLNVFGAGLAYRIPRRIAVR